MNNVDLGVCLATWHAACLLGCRVAKLKWLPAWLPMHLAGAYFQNQLCFCFMIDRLFENNISSERFVIINCVSIHFQHYVQSSQCKDCPELPYNSNNQLKQTPVLRRQNYLTHQQVRIQWLGFHIFLYSQLVFIVQKYDT